MSIPLSSRSERYSSLTLSLFSSDAGNKKQNRAMSCLDGGILETQTQYWTKTTFDGKRQRLSGRCNIRVAEDGKWLPFDRSSNKAPLQKHIPRMLWRRAVVDGKGRCAHQMRLAPGVPSSRALRVLRGARDILSPACAARDDAEALPSARSRFVSTPRAQRVDALIQ